MRVVLSKSQWEQIGKKAGWIKLAKDEDDEEPDMVICNDCRGSGEGHADKTTCKTCKGKGEIPNPKKKQEED